MNTGVIHRRGTEDAEEMQRELTEKIIAAAFEVHTLLGPGLLESVYQAALLHELSLRSLPCKGQALVPLRELAIAKVPPTRHCERSAAIHDFRVYGLPRFSLS